jgi:hypothetical protein
MMLQDDGSGGWRRTDLPRKNVDLVEAIVNLRNNFD